ncbi:hypothetical protein [Crateriforma conspicua]|nr:hypothetical protein [Crateriforma conspicua]
MQNNRPQRSTAIRRTAFPLPDGPLVMAVVSVVSTMADSAGR